MSVDMNDLIKITFDNDNDRPAVSSRQVAEDFEKQHGHILRDIEDYKKDVSNFGEMFFETTEPDAYDRPQKVYHMTRDGFSLLAMGFSGSKALTWKLKYIAAFNAMEAAWNSPEAVMSRALKMASAKLEALKGEHRLLSEKIEADKPKVLFAEAVSASSTSILVGDLAKLLKQNGHDIGQKRLFDVLRQRGYLIKSGSSKNMPTQRAMEMGLFEIKEGSYIDSNGSNITTKTTKVTGKGQVYFVNKFLSSGNKPDGN